MTMRVCCMMMLGLLLSGCGLDVAATFKPPPSYASAGPVLPEDPRLVRILYNAEGTPGRQGILYVAMLEAQIASSYAGRALAATDLATIKNAIGDVLYAIDPTAAPSWRARSAGIVEGWAGRGYGVRRAVREIQSEVRAMGAGATGAGPIAQNAPRVLACTDTMLARADRIVELGNQVLAADSATGLKPVLEQINRLAAELYYGTANLETDRTPGGQCGLEEVRLLLQAMVPATA